MKRWFWIAVVLIVVVLLAFAALNLGSGLVGLISGADFEGERDPMFAEEAETVTRLPEIYPEETQKPHKTLDDYVMEESAPVDKTAQELAREAAEGA